MLTSNKKNQMLPSNDKNTKTLVFLISDTKLNVNFLSLTIYQQLLTTGWHLFLMMELYIQTIDCHDTKNSMSMSKSYPCCITPGRIESIAFTLTKQPISNLKQNLLIQRTLLIVLQYHNLTIHI